MRGFESRHPCQLQANAARDYICEMSPHDRSVFLGYPMLQPAAGCFQLPTIWDAILVHICKRRISHADYSLAFFECEITRARFLS